MPKMITENDGRRQSFANRFKEQMGGVGYAVGAPAARQSRNTHQRLWEYGFRLTSDFYSA
jgi:hypothetical protein